MKTLPNVSFATLSAAEVEQTVLTTYERIAETTLYPGDPVRLFLESLAYVLAVQNQVIDLAGRQNLLAFARAGHLEHLGAPMGVMRLAPAPARCPIRFELAAKLAFEVCILEGTRVGTQDHRLVFVTTATASIPAGALAVETVAVADPPGAVGNGLVPGQVNVLIDPIAYVARVTNTAMSLGGCDAELDEHLRERIQLAPEAFSNAGSEGAYRFHVLSVHADLVAVAVDSPTPGVVDVRPVLTGGELPDEPLLELVREKLSARDVRPLTDTVRVAAPDVVPYAVAGGWYLRRADATLAAAITARVAAALEAYRLWQRSEPGRDINPTRLISLIEQAGAKRVELAEPAFRPLSRVEIARETALNLVFLGVEDE